MDTLLIALGSLVAYLVAYHTYGRYLARRVFGVDPKRLAPSEELSDGVDYVPSHRDLVFGHHFTSIAGTGPILGPAIAVIWGWVPALVWVLVGSILMGAVHDFGSLMASMRHKGRTIGDLAGEVVGPRVRLLFMLVVLVGLWIVLAIFGLVIAGIFRMYPSAVLPSILQIPIAIGLGVFVRRGGSLLVGSVASVTLMYLTIAMSAAWPGTHLAMPEAWSAWISPAAFWTIVLMGYVFVASVLPVQTLLQPRDYINALQLVLAMGLLVVAVVVARPPLVADAVNASPPGAPPMMPLLFITIACGAISGFHCLVASGCSSRQLRTEGDAQFVGYGAMLTEGFLAVLVIIACCAGIGMAAYGGGPTGREAWLAHYASWGGDRGLGILAPVVTGSANMIERVGIPGTGWTIPHSFAEAMMGVFIASFAMTTLDSAGRLQRYVLTELLGGGAASGGGSTAGGAAWGRSLRTNRFVVTGIAVVTAAMLALSDAIATNPETGALNGLAAAGRGGMTLWPVFGATNQLLGGLALLVVTVWLVRTRRPAWATAVPMVFMLLMTGWAIVLLIEQFARRDGQTHLLIIACLMLALEAWIVVEGAAMVLRHGRAGRAGAPAAG